MSALPDLYPGFAERRIDGPAGQIFLRTGGSGPPLLLLHGYPQTHVAWHKMAPEFAEHFTLVIPDLRGYGSSVVPPGDAEHKIYSKRAMAEDCLAIMHALGHDHFMVAGHDRGGRVAYRLALDHPHAVRAMVLIDIIPTAEQWQRMRAESALKSYHWPFLAQPRPLPETLINAAPAYYLEHTLASWTKPRDLSPFAVEALVHYRACLQDPARVHAVCEDYRAGAGIDRALDEADMRTGRKITCPMFVLWASDYLKPTGETPLDVWRAWCPGAKGASVDSGHLIMEENSKDALAALLPFLLANCDGA
jgi:haloacetate dehalogenase